MSLKILDSTLTKRGQERILTRNYRCLHTWVPYHTGYGWNRPTFKAQCSLFTFSSTLYTILLYIV